MPTAPGGARRDPPPGAPRARRPVGDPPDDGRRRSGVGPRQPAASAAVLRPRRGRHRDGRVARRAHGPRDRAGRRRRGRHRGRGRHRALAGRQHPRPHAGRRPLDGRRAAVRRRADPRQPGRDLGHPRRGHAAARLESLAGARPRRAHRRRGGAARRPGPLPARPGAGDGEGGAAGGQRPRGGAAGPWPRRCARATRSAPGARSRSPASTDDDLADFFDAVALARETFTLRHPRRRTRERVPLYAEAAQQMDYAVRNTRVLARRALNAIRRHGPAPGRAGRRRRAARRRRPRARQPARAPRAGHGRRGDSRSRPR